jgi:hypothetical protein
MDNIKSRDIFSLKNHYFKVNKVYAPSVLAMWKNSSIFVVIFY